MDKSSAHVVMLKGKNYPTWKVQFKMFLIKDEMFRIVNGTEVTAAECSNGEVQCEEKIGLSQ